MQTIIRTKLRKAIQDTAKSSHQAYTAGSGRTFVIARENASAVTLVTVQGTTIGSNYTYDSASQTVTISAGYVSSGNAVVVYFTYTKYSSTELNNYIDYALDKLNENDYTPSANPDIGFQITGTTIVPIPTLKEQSLIAIIAAILIKPEYSEYKTPSTTIRYPKNLDRDEKIARAIARFNYKTDGYSGVIERF